MHGTEQVAPFKRPSVVCSGLDIPCVGTSVPHQSWHRPLTVNNGRKKWARIGTSRSLVCRFSLSWGLSKRGYLLFTLRQKQTKTHATVHKIVQPAISEVSSALERRKLNIFSPPPPKKKNVFVFFVLFFQPEMRFLPLLELPSRFWGTKPPTLYKQFVPQTGLDKGNPCRKKNSVVCVCVFFGGGQGGGREGAGESAHVIPCTAVAV